MLSNSPNKERKVELAVTATDAQEGRWKLMESITLLRRVRSTSAKAAGTSPGEYELEGDEGPGRADRARYGFLSAASIDKGDGCWHVSWRVRVGGW